MDNREASADEFYCLGLNPARFQILLTIIRASEPIYGSEIARRTGLSPMRISRHLPAIENEGLIVGTPPFGQRNGMKVTYVPTDAARGIFDNAAAQLADAWAERDSATPQQ